VHLVKTQTIFRFGALATFLTAVGVTIANLIYFFGSVNTVFYIWWSTTIYVLWVFAYFAVFAVQAKRYDDFVFAGFVLLVVAAIFAIIQNTGNSIVVLGFLTEAQLGSGNNSTIAAVNFISLWTYVVGSVLFGIGMLRVGIFPRWIGMLMIVIGVLWIINDNPVAFPIYAILLSITWGWLSWSLWKMTKEMMADNRKYEPTPSVNLSNNQ
jgi:hypothetical protein